MPRRKANVMQTPGTAKSHKRQLSSATPATVIPGSRTSKRLKESASNTPTTVKTSKYFEPPDSDVDEDEPNSEDVSGSGYEDEVESSVAELSTSPSPSSDDEADYDSEESGKKKKKVGSRPGASKATGLMTSAVEGGKELWRQGVKAGLGPGKQVFIERPKPRGDGGIKYVPEKIHPNTMAFLADLKKNNDREWLKSMCSLPS